MRGTKKGSNAKRTPLSNYHSTGESSTTKQRYQKQTLQSQFIATKNEFFDGVYTMKTVAVKLNIDRANICRYVALLKSCNSIYLVKSELCPVTKHRAGFYTTNPKLLPHQLQLFPYEY